MTDITSVEPGMVRRGPTQIAAPPEAARRVRLPTQWLGVAPFFIFAVMFLILPTAYLMLGAFQNDAGEFNLEEDRGSHSYRWASVEPKRLASGHVNPATVEEALQLHTLLLQMAPYHLDISAMQTDSMDVLYYFDFLFQGNHDEVVAEALAAGTPLEGLAQIPGGRVLINVPTWRGKSLLKRGAGSSAAHLWGQRSAGSARARCNRSSTKLKPWTRGRGRARCARSRWSW